MHVLLLSQIGGVDKYVVDVDNEELVEILSENLVHKCLEDRGHWLAHKASPDTQNGL